MGGDAYLFYFNVDTFKLLHRKAAGSAYICFEKFVKPLSYNRRWPSIFHTVSGAGWLKLIMH